mgnify:FL=1
MEEQVSKKITPANIDDLIRGLKRMFSQSLPLEEVEILVIRWNDEAYEIILDFVETNSSCGFGIEDHIISIMNYCAKHHNHRPKEEGFCFMGVKHFKGAKGLFEVSTTHGEYISFSGYNRNEKDISIEETNPSS